MSADKEKSTERKPYIKPEITHELELETRAGSPFTIDPNVIDLSSPLTRLLVGAADIGRGQPLLCWPVNLCLRCTGYRSNN